MALERPAVLPEDRRDNRGKTVLPLQHAPGVTASGLAYHIPSGIIKDRLGIPISTVDPALRKLMVLLRKIFP